jgi:hypothetical protein
MMRKALVRKGFALAILLAFVAALGVPDEENAEVAPRV